MVEVDTTGVRCRLLLAPFVADVCTTGMDVWSMLLLAPPLLDVCTTGEGLGFGGRGI